MIALSDLPWLAVGGVRAHCLTKGAKAVLRPRPAPLPTLYRAGDHVGVHLVFPVPCTATSENVGDWLELCVAHRGSMSVDNPLNDFEPEASFMQWGPAVMERAR